MATSAIDTLQGLSGKEIKVYDANYDNSQIDQEGFLKVLLTSFQYQDPFEAQDITKFIDNTVKLRELEVMKNFEDSVNALNNNNTLFMNATNLIGKKVLYKGDNTYVLNGKSEVQFSLKKDANYAVVYLSNKEGEIVAKKEYSDLKANEKYVFEVNDETIEDGYYKVSVVAQEGEERVDAKVKATALVIGIEKDGANIVAIYDKGTIDIANIEKIGG
ncbi:flagellar basal-body rod modification protein FlgD [Nitratiruptor sp. YY08-26]|uniref:flagellar hook assembly protein FlgD n=1 Tax=unclassified Nitratiruptor TaxID=2624044 RepID=UPI0019161B55|nr:MULTISPECIES: flagellar hook capping FlgD N-terminal domain-containing protein [unclassified Nitratiruptor]BCD61866.1 flagellar basal-body rod modification protein FlgD [Nitratiruptor sp. YY08-13]BCD65801.1 flagellar basal-body rod modification protein FlgD [Nitratiruptor sp. YY08-26]